VFLFGLAGGSFAEDLQPDGGHLDLLNQANRYFHQANELMDQNPGAARELYHKSLLRFEKLAADGITNGELYYNIGNIHFRLEDIGRAILNYRRAQLFLPGDDNLRQNLSYALSRRHDKLEEQPQEQVLKMLFFWHYEVPAGVRLTLFSFFYSAFWLLLGLRLFWGKKPLLQGGLAGFFLLAVILTVSLFLDYYQAAGNNPGVITAAEVIARKGDGTSYQPSFDNPLHAGTEFQLLEQRGLWLHGELADGRRCWLPAGAVALVKASAR
jgi:tetratricopeptide (TPR) repeat protein